MKVAVIGVGLLGGSFALSLIQNGLADSVVGVDSNAANAEQALKLGLVEAIEPIESAVTGADLVVIAIPVSAIPSVSLRVLDIFAASGNIGGVAIDLGSTKGELCAAIDSHPLRGRFVATHPMWGTEHSGPQAAQKEAFKGRSVVICQHMASDGDALQLVQGIYSKFGMTIRYMGCEEHDLHAAYVSHISHITSFALALTVLEKEREDEAIFDLAGGGFESTVRLAKSSADMWVPILMQNKYNVLDVLRENIHQLQVLRKMIERDDVQGLASAIEKANTINKIIK